MAMWNERVPVEEQGLETLKFYEQGTTGENIPWAGSSSTQTKRERERDKNKNKAVEAK